MLDFRLVNLRMSRPTAQGRNQAALSLHPGAVEHYEDAKFYQSRYRARTEDISYYLRRLRGASRILEYGAGAGRLTVQLAQGGKSVTAVDSSPSMLALLTSNLQDLTSSARKRVSVRQADMRAFRTPKKFDAVVAAFHTLCHLYSWTDMDSFLSRAYAHLLPGGRLEFDLPLPRVDVPGYDPISQVKVTEMDSPGGVQLLTQRWYQPQEIRMYLHYAGFERVKLHSDFSTEKVHSETSVFTVSAQKPQ